MVDDPAPGAVVETTGVAVHDDNSDAPTSATGTSRSGNVRMHLLSLHGQALVLVANTPTISLRHLAQRLDVTEGTMWRTVRDLMASGIVTRERVGRASVYTGDRSSRHAGVSVNDIVSSLTE